VCLASFLNCLARHLEHNPEMRPTQAWSPQRFDALSDPIDLARHQPNRGTPVHTNTETLDSESPSRDSACSLRHMKKSRARDSVAGCAVAARTGQDVWERCRGVAHEVSILIFAFSG